MTSVLAKPVKKNVNQKVKLYCTACWTDREVTTNGKCLACGFKFAKPKHWVTTLKKISESLQHEGTLPVDILGVTYFLPREYIDRYRFMNLDDFMAVGEFINDIKSNCESAKVKA